MMVSGPNLNETSIVSGGYGGTAEGIIPTGTIKGNGAGLGGKGDHHRRKGLSSPYCPPLMTQGSAVAQPRCLGGGLCSRWARVLCRGNVWGRVLMAEEGLLPPAPLSLGWVAPLSQGGISAGESPSPWSGHPNGILSPSSGEDPSSVPVHTQQELWSVLGMEGQVGGPKPTLY